MAKLRKIEGIVPSVFVVYTDETCRTIDEDVYREHLRYLLKHDIGALVCGGHAGETESLTSQEKIRLLKIAQEETKGKIPVVGGVIAESTQDAIKQGLEAKEAGAEALLCPAPYIMGWIDRGKDSDFMVEHFRRFDEAVDIPIILFGSPNNFACYGIRAETFKAIAQRVESVVACKITANWDLFVFDLCTRALKSVRDIGCLIAGSHNIFGSLLVGGDGNLCGAANFMVKEEVEILKAVRSGDLVKAKEVENRIMLVNNAVFGYYGYLPGMSWVHFHYMYKIGAWLMGLIPRPHMRLPQMPPPFEQIKLLREAMVEAGMPVEREAQEFTPASA